MALKQLGSSLLAKNQPGSATRLQKERSIEGISVPGKGESGTLSRDLVQEPIEQKVPAGTDKVVRARPTVDETGGIPSDQVTDQPSANLLPGTVGLVPPSGGVTAPIPVSQQRAAEAAAQAVGNNNPSPPSQGGEATTPAPQTAPQSSPASLRSFQRGALPSILNRFGGRTIADAGRTLRSKVDKSGRRSFNSFA